MSVDVYEHKITLDGASGQRNLQHGPTFESLVLDEAQLQKLSCGTILTLQTILLAQLLPTNLQ